MLIQTTSINAISKEKTLRYDVDYIKYHQSHADNYYTFSDLFYLVSPEPVCEEILYDDFKYCEIGNAQKSGDVLPINLNFQSRNLEDENYYSKIEKGDITSVDIDDILIAKVRPNLKKYVRIIDNIKNVYFTTAFMRLKAKEMPEILYYCLRSIFYNDLMAIARQGKGYPTINEKDIVTLRFEKTIIDRLRKKAPQIQSYIWDIENKIASAKLKIKTSQDIINSVFQSEFDFDYNKFDELKNLHFYSSQHMVFSNNPDLRFSAKYHRPAGDFVMQQLSNKFQKKIKHFLAEPIALGASVSPKDYCEEGTYKYISMATIKNWCFDYESANTVSDAYANYKNAKTVKKDDIIMARSGEGTIGKVALIADDNLDGIFADFTMRIRLKDYNPEFAYYYFRTKYFQYLVEVYKKGLGNNTNIFPIVVQEFPLPDISLKEQQRIVNRISSEIKKQQKIENNIAELRSQIDYIIEQTIRTDYTNEP